MMNWNLLRKCMLIGLMIIFANRAFAEELHYVSSGETLQKISFKYFKTKNCWQQIVKANDLSSHDKIEVGDQLTIPAWESCYKPKSHAKRVMANAKKWGYTPSPGFQKVLNKLDSKVESVPKDHNKGDLLIFKR